MAALLLMTPRPEVCRLGLGEQLACLPASPWEAEGEGEGRPAPASLGRADGRGAQGRPTVDSGLAVEGGGLGGAADPKQEAEG